MSYITVRNLNKQFKIAQRKSGLKEAIKSFIKKKYIYIDAVKDISFDIKEGDEISAGDLTLKVLHTPGHTPGSVCFVADDGRAIFAGDTLFSGSIGRTDFPGGDWGAMAQSLKKLMHIPEDYCVYPGHGECTSIGKEKRTNQYCLHILRG